MIIHKTTMTICVRSTWQWGHAVLYNSAAYTSVYVCALSFEANLFGESQYAPHIY